MRTVRVVCIYDVSEVRIRNACLFGGDVAPSVLCFLTHSLYNVLMRFEVPQFIDIEDKMFGPFTFKQFVYLAGGAGLIYVSYKLAPFPLWIPLVLFFGGMALLLAFYKLNNRPFIEVAQSFVNFSLKGKVYIWRRTPPAQQKIEAAKPKVIPLPPTKKFDEKTVTDLAQNLDILDSYRK